jgi:hypothetical protein
MPLELRTVRIMPMIKACAPCNIVQEGHKCFTNISCLSTGTTCPDPGYPRGGYLSGDANGFKQQQVVTFGCNRAGFSIPSGSALECRLTSTADSLVWNSTTPTECQGKCYIQCY